MGESVTLELRFEIQPRIFGAIGAGNELVIEQPFPAYDGRGYRKAKQKVVDAALVAADAAHSGVGAAKETSRGILKNGEWYTPRQERMQVPMRKSVSRDGSRESKTHTFSVAALRREKSGKSGAGASC